MKLKTIKRVLTTIILALILYGCGSNDNTVQEVSRESIGKTVDAQVIPTSFNESIKMLIKTEKRIIIYYGLIDLPLGIQSYIITDDKGRKWLGFDGTHTVFFVSNN